MTFPADQLYEEMLVLRSQAGDEAAFTELVERFGPRLLYFVRKMLHNDDRALDILQEVWFDAYRGLPRLEEPRALLGWLYRIARDRCYRELRKKRPVAQSLEDVDLPPTASADDGDFTPEDAARIHAALDQLAPEHREVLVLRFLEEMNYEEIARITACPVGTVRSRIHYGKRSLKRALERNIHHE